MDFMEEKPLYLLEEENIKMEEEEWMDKEETEKIRLIQVQHDHTYYGKKTVFRGLNPSCSLCPKAENRVEEAKKVDKLILSLAGVLQGESIEDMKRFLNSDPRVCQSHFTEALKCLENHIFTNSDSSIHRIKQLLEVAKSLNVTLSFDQSCNILDKFKIRIQFLTRTPTSNTDIFGEKIFRNFLGEKCKNVEKPFVLEKLVEEYKTISGSMESTDFFLQLINNHRRLINYVNLDLNTKIEQMFALQAPVYCNVVNVLRENAFVYINENLLIVSYLSFDGSLKLNWEYETEGQSMNLIQFAMERCENADSPITIASLVREYKNTTGSTKSEMRLRPVLASYRDNLHKINMDAISKLKQSFWLKAPLSMEFLQNLRESGIVKVDTMNRIIEYESNDGNLSLGNLSKDFINFLEKKCENVENPLAKGDLFKEFRRTTEHMTTYTGLEIMFCEYKDIIQKREDIDLNTKVKRMFGLVAPVDPNFLIELQQNATVEVDQCQRITFYKSHDGSLFLQKKHYGSRAGKSKKHPNSISEVKLEPFEGELNGFRMETMDDGNEYIEEIKREIEEDESDWNEVKTEDAQPEVLLDPKQESVDDTDLMSEGHLDPKIEVEDVKFDLFS